MKNLKTLAMALALTLSLASCGNQTQNETKNDSQVSEETQSEDSKETTEETSEDKTETADYSDITGTYNGKATGYGSDIEVAVDIENGVITDIKTTENETKAVGSQALDKMRERVITFNSIDVDRVSGATISSAAFLSAIDEALQTAGIDADKLAKEDLKDEKKDSYDTSVVVVGAGGAGLSTAIELAQKGVDVMIVEKAGITGGNTAYASAGMNAAETRLQKEENVPDTVDLFVKDTMEGGKNLNNPDLVNILASESSDAIDWLEENGVIFKQLKFSGGQSEMRTHAPLNDEGKSIPVGSYLVDKLTQKANELGIEIVYDAKVNEVIMEDGKAKGVKAETKDGSITVNADAVVIASGGFGGNMDLITHYNPDLEGYVSTNAKSIEGDAIGFLEEIGANFIDMDQIQIHPTVYQKNGSLISEGLRGEGAILVNSKGERFYNELETRDNVSAAILDQDGKNAWLIVDQGMYDQSATIQKYAEKGYLEEASDMKALAELIGCDEETIAKNIEGWNEIVKNNQDPDFGREGMDTVTSDLSKAPYYAVQIAPGIHHTMGGVEVNTKSEVIDKDGNPIPGLYAAGEVTGGVHGANRLGGNAITDIVVFGRNAAKNASEYIGQ